MSLSPEADCVSQVAYRFPARSVLRFPSIHQVRMAMDPALAPTSTAGDHVFAAVRRRGEVLMPGMHSERSRIELVAPHEGVDHTVGLDDDGCVVAAASREARLHRGNRSPGLPVVRRLLDYRSGVHRAVSAATGGGADDIHVRGTRPVVPGDVDRAAASGGDEVPVSPVASDGRNQGGRLGEGCTVVEGGCHHRVGVVVVVPQVGHIDSPVPRD
jgi:hypothetical protein